MTDYLPLGQNRAWGTPLPKGVKRPDKLDTGPLVYVISPGYMRAMGTRVRGRDFTWSDGPKSEQVVMINESYAQFLNSLGMWPDGNAVGQGSGEWRRTGPERGWRCGRCARGERGWRCRLADLLPAIRRPVPIGAELVVRTSLPPASLATSVLTTLREH